MIYILCFILCILIDNLKRRNIKFYKVLIGFVVIILCFGYTCGSDWRHYEIMYYHHDDLDSYRLSEFGFVTYFELMSNLISDFWITNAISKAIFLFSLASFFKLFTLNNWSCVGLSFAFKTLFLIIDCPMRFMLGMAILLMGMKSLLERKLLKYSVFAVIATLFQNTLIVIAILNLLLLISDKIYKIKKKWLFSIVIASFIISKSESIYLNLFNSFGNMLNISGMADNRFLFYSFFNIGGNFITVENIWHFILLTIIIINKKLFEKLRYGKIIFTGSWLYIVFEYAFIAIPTCFRLVILLGFIFVLALDGIIRIGWKYLGINYKVMSSSIVIWLCIIITKDVYSLPAYYPYTNSIPYILTGHLDYGYRDKYNYIEFEKDMGKL